ncbi:thermopsin, partial [Candidatus Marsarchaeota archaeon]|nr:thermopsin [Candidatus Marsarchaeota archaeon]
RMLSSISLYYMSGGSILEFPSYLTFGSDTAEGASDLTVVPSPNGALVTTGTENYNEYILPSGSYTPPAPTSSVTTSTVPSTSTSTVTSTATTTIFSSSTTVQSPPAINTTYVSGVSIEELVAVLVILIIVLLVIGIAAHKRANRGA